MALASFCIYALTILIHTIYRYETLQKYFPSPLVEFRLWRRKLSSLVKFLPTEATRKGTRNKKCLFRIPNTWRGARKWKASAKNKTKLILNISNMNHIKHTATSTYTYTTSIHYTATSTYIHTYTTNIHYTAPPRIVVYKVR